MADTKRVAAIVRGPKPYFDRSGKLYGPGELVPGPTEKDPMGGIPEDEVSDEDFFEKTVDVQLAQPVVDKDGNLIDTAKKKVQVRVQFRPADASVARASGSPNAALTTETPDRLNVNDFLKQGVEDIESAIASGNVDPHLPAIEQGEIAGKKARKGVIDAVKARRAAITA